MYTPLHDFKCAMMETTKRNLSEQITLILQIWQMERDNAATHSQRNAYQNVIRHELEVLQEHIAMADTNVFIQGKVLDDVPF